MVSRRTLQRSANPLDGFKGAASQQGGRFAGANDWEDVTVERGQKGRRERGDHPSHHQFLDLPLGDFCMSHPPPISHVLGGVEVNKQALDGFTSFTADYNQGLLGLSLSVRSVPVMLTQWRNYRAGQRGS